MVYTQSTKEAIQRYRHKNRETLNAKNKNKNDKKRKHRPKNPETKLEKKTDDKLVHIFKIMLEKQ